MRYKLALTAAVFTAFPANAATYFAEIHGTLTSQIDKSFNDPHLKVGDTLTLTAQLSDDFLNTNYDPYSGYFDHYIVAPLDSPIKGATFFRIDGPGMTWLAGDDINSGPAIAFAGGKITGMLFSFAPDGDSRPAMQTGGETTVPIGPGDKIFDGHGLYTSTYTTPGFNISWDYAGSTFTPLGAAVPEPGSWAMMIAGFSLAGSALRQRRTRGSLLAGGGVTNRPA